MSEHGLRRMEQRAAAAGAGRGAGRTRRPPNRRRAYLVGLASVLVLAGAFVAIGFALGSFDTGSLGWVAFLGPLFGLPALWSGVIRVVDPTIPVTFSDRHRNRMFIGGVEQIVETRAPDQTARMKRGFSATMIAIGLLAYGIGIGCLVKASAPARHAAEQASP